MRVTDIAAFVGEYPYRELTHTSADWLIRQMDRVGIERAWVGYLPTLLHRDPAAGNARLHEEIAGYPGRLAAVPVVHPGLPRWEQDLNAAIEAGAPAVRVYPSYHALDPSGPEMRVLAAATAAAGLPVVLTVRIEDSRQRHPLDVGTDLPASSVRNLVRSDSELRLLVTHADRPFVEEVHFGLTPRESERVLWDFSWIWGPPENHLALLLTTVGIERFTLGTGMPLRIPDSAMAKLDLLDIADSERGRLLGGNLETWSAS
jgi:predicted TIM-barrel fold metal-dependent hydrolase